MLLGGQILKSYDNPTEWVSRIREAGFQAVYFPVDHTASAATIRAYAQAARQADLCIAEVGAWSNPLSPDAKEADKAMAYCCSQLRLADEVKAACCVNIAGSCSTRWDGPHPDNFSRKTFDRIAAMTREIIDSVKPRHTFFTLELMPWIFPDSADTYLHLLWQIGRERFAVHLDPVNIICSPRAYDQNGALIEDAFRKLGPYIKSCHAKDIRLEEELTTHLNETHPGQGNLDYRTYLSCLEKLDAKIPLMMEHMQTPAQVEKAAVYLRSLASDLNIRL